MSPLSLFFTIASFVLIADITVAQGAVCQAGISAAGAVEGYAGSTHTMLTVDNYLASTYVGANNADQCKFRINIGTQVDPSVQLGQRIKRMAIKFGVDQNNPSNYERKFIVSQPQGTVKVNGLGMSSTIVADGCYQTSTGSEPWYFCLVPEPSGCWTIDFGVPTQGCEGSATYCETGTVGNNSGHDLVTITLSAYYNGLLHGMCGNDNGPPDCNIGNVDPVTCAV